MQRRHLVVVGDVDIKTKRQHQFDGPRLARSRRRAAAGAGRSRAGSRPGRGSPRAIRRAAASLPAAQCARNCDSTGTPRQQQAEDLGLPRFQRDLMRRQAGAIDGIDILMRAVCPRRQVVAGVIDSRADRVWLALQFRCDQGRASPRITAAKMSTLAPRLANSRAVSSLPSASFHCNGVLQ